jgi:hypothetical protein
MHEQSEEEKLRRRPAGNGASDTSRWLEAARREALRHI